MNQIPVFSAGINVSGGSIAGTLSTAAQANITSLGTLTALTVDDVAINGKVMTMTGSTDDTAVFTVGTNGTLTIETTDTAAAAGNIQITADGTAELAGTTVTLDSGADIVLDAAGNNVTFKSGGTSILDISNSSSDAVITSSVQDKDIIFKGDDGGSAVTALTLDMSAAGAASFNNNVTVGGDLTVTGDDIFMNTNTSGAALIADGTNFNPVVISGDISIGTSGTAAIGSGVVVNADVSSSAAIAFSKMEDLTASRALYSNGSGDVDPDEHAAAVNNQGGDCGFPMGDDGSVMVSRPDGSERWLMAGEYNMNDDGSVTINKDGEPDNGATVTPPPCNDDRGSNN